MARSIIQILEHHPEIRELPNSIPLLHHLAAEHQLGSWQTGARGFVKRFDPAEEAQLLRRLRQGGRRYDPYAHPG
ncbi:MAG: hypothetical protein ACOC45_01310 [Alkalispirochaetaceae bacterium]